MVPLIVTEPVQVENFLESRFQLPRDVLLDVVWSMVRARRDCTSDHAAGAPPILAYHAGTAMARKVMAPFGYVRNDADQIEATFHPDLGVKIVVANTDEGTGLEEHLPRNVSGKGPATRRTVDAAQGSFIEALDASLPVVPFRAERPRDDGVSVWYLCVFEKGDEVRAELSRPKSLSGDFFAGFHAPRIFLIGRDGGDMPVKRRDDNDGDEFDIPVVRR